MLLPCEWNRLNLEKANESELHSPPGMVVWKTQWPENKMTRKRSAGSSTAPNKLSSKRGVIDIV